METLSCFSYFLLVILLMNIVCFSHNLYIYLVVNTVLYFYALPIDYLLTSYSSLCLSYNTSQA